MLVESEDRALSDFCCPDQLLGIEIGPSYPMDRFPIGLCMFFRPEEYALLSKGMDDTVIL
jgi:hypothetical protein